MDFLITNTDITSTKTMPFGGQTVDNSHRKPKTIKEITHIFKILNALDINLCKCKHVAHHVTIMPFR